MKSLIQNKRGGFTDLFIFMIFTFVIIIVLGVLGFIFTETEDQLQETIGKMDLGDGQGNNASQVVTNTVGAFNLSFTALYWLSILIIFGMILGIFIGSFMVTTKPVFFIPFLFLWIIAIIVSVPISNSYETLSQHELLADSYSNFVGGSFILNHLPMIVAIVGIIGAIIMFTRMGKQGDQFGGFG